MHTALYTRHKKKTRKKKKRRVYHRNRQGRMSARDSSNTSLLSDPDLAQTVWIRLIFPLDTTFPLNPADEFIKSILRVPHRPPTLSWMCRLRTGRRWCTGVGRHRNNCRRIGEGSVFGSEMKKWKQTIDERDTYVCMYICMYKEAGWRDEIYGYGGHGKDDEVLVHRKGSRLNLIIENWDVYARDWDVSRDDFHFLFDSEEVRLRFVKINCLS